LFATIAFDDDDRAEEEDFGSTKNTCLLLRPLHSYFSTKIRLYCGQASASNSRAGESQKKKKKKKRNDEHVIIY